MKKEINSAFIKGDPTTPLIPVYDEGFSDGAKVGTFYGWIFGMCTAIVVIYIIVFLTS